MKRTVVLLIILALVGFVSSAVSAQDASNKAKQNKSCPEPVYQNSKDLSRRVKIKSKPQPNYTDEARNHGVEGRVLLRVVFCQSGEVTDIQVLEGLPFGMTERVIKSAGKIQFVPAEKEGRTVSQRLLLEYIFNLR